MTAKPASIALVLVAASALAQAQRGSVRADSTVGKGTTFTVCLPRAAGEVVR